MQSEASNIGSWARDWRRRWLAADSDRKQSDSIYKGKSTGQKPGTEFSISLAILPERL